MAWEGSTGLRVAHAWLTGPLVEWEEVRANASRPHVAPIEARAEASEPRMAWTMAQGGRLGCRGN
jgi:hypothetical protein